MGNIFEMVLQTQSRLSTKRSLVALFAAFLFVSSLSQAQSSQCHAVFLSIPAQRLPLISMDSRYVGEDKGLYVDPVTKKPWQVKYFTESERQNYELVIKDKLLWGRDGKKAESEFDPEGMSFENSLLVIDRDHRIFALPFEERGKFHHSSLSAGEEVLFAGTIAFAGGRVREISDRSGHYKPTAQQVLLVLKDLQRRGLDLSGMKLSGHVAQELGNTYVMTPKEVAPFLQD